MATVHREIDLLLLYFGTPATKYSLTVFKKSTTVFKTACFWKVLDSLHITRLTPAFSNEPARGRLTASVLIIDKCRLGLRILHQKNSSR